MSQRWREWFGNALLLMAALLVSLVGFEAALRLVRPQKLYRFPRGLFRADPELVFGLSPGFAGVIRSAEFSTRVRINSLGLRNPEIGAKGPGVRRVLVVGDSFVSSLNVEEDETLVSAAARALDRDIGPGRAELINAGVPNYGTWHELGVLRRFASPLDIDAAVLCVFVGNDLDGNLRPRGVIVQDGFLVERVAPTGLLPRPVRWWLQRNSMAYVFLWNVWDQARTGLQGQSQDVLGAFRELISPGPYPKIEEGYEKSASLLKEARDFLAGRGISLLVVVIPQEIQVYPERFAALVASDRGSGGVELDLTLPNRRWTEIAQSLGLPVIDLLPLLRRENSGPPLFHSLDTHLTVDGNRIAGEAVAMALMPLIRQESLRP